MRLREIGREDTKHVVEAKTPLSDLLLGIIGYTLSNERAMHTLISERKHFTI